MLSFINVFDIVCDKSRLDKSLPQWRKESRRLPQQDLQVSVMPQSLAHDVSTAFLPVGRCPASSLTGMEVRFGKAEVLLSRGQGADV